MNEAPPLTAPPEKQRECVEIGANADGSRVFSSRIGQTYQVEVSPSYELEYQSLLDPQKTYTRQIAIFGRCEDRPHLFEAWCYLNDDLRTFAFHKVVRITELSTRREFGADFFRVQLGGETSLNNRGVE